MQRPHDTTKISVMITVLQATLIVSRGDGWRVCFSMIASNDI